MGNGAPWGGCSVLLSAESNAAGPEGSCFPQPGLLLLCVRKGRCSRVASWCSGPVLGCSSYSGGVQHSESTRGSAKHVCGPVRAPVHPRASLYVPCRWAAGKKTGQEKMNFTIDHAQGELCEASCIPIAERTAEHFAHGIPPALGAPGSRCLRPHYPAVGRCGDTEPSASERCSRYEAGGGSAAATSASTAHTMAPLTADRPPCGDEWGWADAAPNLRTASRCIRRPESRGMRPQCCMSQLRLLLPREGCSGG